MKYLTYDELVDKTGLKPFQKLGEWMRKIADSAVVITSGDYWLWVEDDLDDEAIKRAWSRRISHIDGYCSMMEPSVEARLNAASNGKAGATKTKTKFNDTPDTAGDYSDDEHTSTVTTAEQSGELSSLEEDEIAKIYSIMQSVQYDIILKFTIPEEYV